MKKIGVTMVMLCMIFILSGCDLWMSGQYQSVTPHLGGNKPNTQSNIEVSSYMQIQNKLEQLVEQGAESAVFYYSAINEQYIESYMDSAISHVCKFTPIGAYAVQEITCEIGSSSGRQAVAVNISYIHGRSEILRIRKTSNMQGVYTLLHSALRNFDSNVTILVDRYQADDIQQYIRDYVDQNPDICMEQPQTVISVFPESGEQRIVEVELFYQNGREELRKMQNTVKPVFDSAELYVSGDGEVWEKYFQLYSFLMERFDYRFETSITPSYHLLRHGVGDCKAFANVYAAMCRRAGLDCRVVSGTHKGESWYWNVIVYEGSVYYVDLISSNEKGHFHVKTQEEMSDYVWDYDLYHQETQPVTP